MKFAKLFEVGYGEQVLVTKSYDPDSTETSYHLTQTTEIIGVVVVATASYYKAETCNKAFEEYDQTKAEVFYKAIEGQFN